MASKGELPQKPEFRIKHWKNQGHNTAFIRSGNELTQNLKCTQIFKEHGIQLTPSAPYNPHQNGIAMPPSAMSMEFTPCSTIPQGLWPTNRPTCLGTIVNIMITANESERGDIGVQPLRKIGGVGEKQ